jgi:hypothetical protein
MIYQVSSLFYNSLVFSRKLSYIRKKTINLASLAIYFFFSSNLLLLIYQIPKTNTAPRAMGAQITPKERPAAPVAAPVAAIAPLPATAAPSVESASPPVPTKPDNPNVIEKASYFPSVIY